MDNSVPYIVYEGEAARHERTVKRLIILLIITITLLFASNMAWLAYMNSFDTVTTTTVQDTNDGGNANYIGGSNGVISNGAADSENNNEN